jgi:TRAP-type mannitol/chloroaromatic compound transport system substrate-binding protein
VVAAAAQAANCDQLAKYDAVNPPSVKRLARSGAQLRAFAQEILDAAFQASHETYDELSARNPDFKKIWDSIRAYRADAYLWFQLPDYSFDTYMMRQQRNGKL